MSRAERRDGALVVGCGHTSRTDLLVPVIFVSASMLPLPHMFVAVQLWQRPSSVG
jgi:hypothetical protein